ncbi:MAG TPA: MBL fold metallo-hydrolase [Dehalococcoidia bacterium]|jgi:glyoxylase-like metal-dependent hydrolase (beta-lactamase superfamily II)|nr:MBL fold metallo-hydrolase [Dehalococcoidia bacterium]
MVDIKEVAENIYLIDNRLYGIPKWGSVYLINESKKALIDAGPTTSVATVLEGIKKIGVEAGDINYVMVTHIHLDHAGGAGVLLESMPQAQVVVHHKGARHLVDPTRLVSSVAETQGEKAMRMFGQVAPIAEERVKPVSGGEVIDLSEKQALRIVAAPGHASHELCIYESRNNGLFSGDAIGISVLENEVVLPVTPEPSFDLEQYLDTLERLMALGASRIYFAHFDASGKVQENLELARNKLQAWDKIIARAIAEGGLERAAEEFRAQLLRELEPVRKRKSLYKYLTDGIIAMNVAGFIKYYQGKSKS